MLDDLPTLLCRIDHDSAPHLLSIPSRPIPSASPIIGIRAHSIARDHLRVFPRREESHRRSLSLIRIAPFGQSWYGHSQLTTTSRIMEGDSGEKAAALKRYGC
jgi:hypothetical protein